MRARKDRTQRTEAGRAEELLSPGLVHELRQPLTGVDAGLKLVARQVGASVTDLDAWKLATSQLARLAEVLETYQQLMTGGAIEPGPFPVDAVVRRAVAGQRHRLEGLRDRFAVVVEIDVPRGYGSPQALHHAVGNLLANAIDAVEECEGDRRIEVRVLRDPARPAAQVRVADDGAGIHAALRGRLFARRFTTKAPGKGSGLGLAIARRMMRAAGGEVRLGADGDPVRRPWSRTELVVEVAASADAPAPLAPDPAPTWRPPARAALVSGAVGVAVVLAVASGWAGFQRWVRAEDSAVAAVAPAASPVADVVDVAEVEGNVERLRSGSWSPLAAGERLHEEDTVRTAPGGRATIGVGERSRVTVSESTQLTVREMTAAVHRLRLARGRISVDHQADGARVLVVESETGESVARAGAARFSVLANGAALAVATEAGVVRLQASDGIVDVAAGEQSSSFRGQAPVASGPIPRDLLLDVARSAGLGDGSCGIKGRVEPGSEVRVEGRVIAPGPDGRFSARVSAPRGTTHVTLVTRDAAGRTRERRVSCARAADPTVVSDFAVRWGQE